MDALRDRRDQFHVRAIALFVAKSSHQRRAPGNNPIHHNHNQFSIVDVCMVSVADHDRTIDHQLQGL